jgi:hypothetical protein
MSHKLNPLLLIVVFISFSAFAQNEVTKQKIAKHLDDYFELERENIHLHLNKDIYLTDESIWFKGYAYNRKDLLPFYSTSNVFVALYNQSGTLIEQQLAFSNTGTFEGVFKNLKKLPSGNYYIQSYTNWMNNFSEDESSIYPIKIVNSSEPNFFDTSKIDLASAVIEIMPEGGTLVYGISNVIGVKLADRFNNPIGNLLVELRDSKDKVISEIMLNKDGLGKFMFTPNSENFSLNTKLGGNIVTHTIPPSTVIGVTIEVNNYALNNKASIKIKTNAATFKTLESKKLFLVVHQDQRALLFDVELDPNTFDQNLVFSTESLPQGVHFIRIIDENMIEFAQRAFVKTLLTSQTFNLTKKSSGNGTMQLSCTSTRSDANLSISILPANSIANEKSVALNADLVCNSYMIQPIKNLDYYTTTPTIAKRYELDLALLTQTRSKYVWNTIVNQVPKPDFEFDMGLTVKGTLLSPSLKNPEAYNVRLRSFFHQILIQSPITTTGDFEFKNLLLNDSTTVDFGLFKNTNQDPLKLKSSAKIVNGKRAFKFSFKGLYAADLNQTPNTTTEDLPSFFEGSIQLTAVEVASKKNALQRSENLENRNLRGYKVPETATTTVLYYIGVNGFNVVDSPTQVSITSRTTTSASGGVSQPVIYLDNIQLFDFTILQNLLMDELDEIYMNPNAIVPSGRNFNGIIRMYRKEPKMAVSKTNLQQMVLMDGFAKPQKFENPSYNATSTEGFIKYGVVNWIPTVLTDDKNAFEIDVPNYNQKKVKVIIEGFTYDGQFISETQVVDL